MDITTRNFFRLLRAGAFGNEEQIEPMSAWKWQQVYRYAVMHNVVALLYDGICHCQGQFFLMIPEPLMAQWRQTVAETSQQHEQTYRRLTEIFAQQERMQLRPVMLGGVGLAMLYPQPPHRPTDTIDIFFPYETQGKKADRWARDNGKDAAEHRGLLCYEWQSVRIAHHHRLAKLSNSLHAYALEDIVEQEFSECSPTYALVSGMRIEQPSPTLQLLGLLVSFARQLLTSGVSLLSLTDLAIFLRKAGDKVDFVKLQGWTERLHLTGMERLTGTLLVRLLGLEADEVPFMEKEHKHIAHVTDNLFTQHRHKQTGDKFLRKGSHPNMFGQMKQSARYFRYYPTESTANIIGSFVHGIIHVEE